MKTLFIAGHQGLVGSALFRQFQPQPDYKILVRTRAELDLTDAHKTQQFFKEYQPEWVILAAAKVGGIHGNNSQPTEFLLDNLKIQNSVIESALKYDTKKLLFLGSSCIFPKNCKQPMSEDDLLTGKLEPTNEAYAIAKIAGLKLCAAIRRQYNKDFICAMPSNLYGPNDNYHPQNAHALPMLLRRIHEAKEQCLPETIIWGTGKPRREFLHSDDLASACRFLLESVPSSELGEFINVGTGEDCTIQELAETICEVVGYQGRLVYDHSKPDGTLKKLLDVTKINRLGWQAQISLKEGLKQTYADFIQNTKLRR